MHLPNPETESRKTAETPTPFLDQNRQHTAVPLLSDVVIPGAVLTEAVKTASANTARSMPADHIRTGERQLLGQLGPRIGALIELSIREALSGASDQIVRNVLIRLHRQLSALPANATETPTPETPNEP